MKILLILALITEVFQISMYDIIESISAEKDKDKKTKLVQEDIAALTIYLPFGILYLITTIIGVANGYWQAIGLLIMTVSLMISRKIHKSMGKMRPYWLSLMDFIICSLLIIHWMWNLK